MERKCKTCRYWDRLYIDSLEGDCRAPSNHRYWRIPMENKTFALMDSFGGQTTKFNEGCNAWRVGQEDGKLDLRETGA